MIPGGYKRFCRLLLKIPSYAMPPSAQNLYNMLRATTGIRNTPRSWTTSLIQVADLIKIGDLRSAVQRAASLKTQERAKVLSGLPYKDCGRILNHMSLVQASESLVVLLPYTAAKILDEITPRLAAMLLILADDRAAVRRAALMNPSHLAAALNDLPPEKGYNLLSGLTMGQKIKVLNACRDLTTAKLLFCEDPDRQVEIIVNLEPEKACAVIDLARPEVLKKILDSLTDSELARILDKMEPPVALRILDPLDIKRKAEMLAMINSVAAARILVVFEPALAGKLLFLMLEGSPNRLARIGSIIHMIDRYFKLSLKIDPILDAFWKEVHQATIKPR